MPEKISKFHRTKTVLKIARLRKIRLFFSRQLFRKIIFNTSGYMITVETQGYR